MLYIDVSIVWFLQLADYKINLRTAEEMANAYRKSNEDKSILILGLKEQLLELEREVCPFSSHSF